MKKILAWLLIIGSLTALSAFAKPNTKIVVPPKASTGNMKQFTGMRLGTGMKLGTGMRLGTGMMPRGFTWTQAEMKARRDKMLAEAKVRRDQMKKQRDEVLAKRKNVQNLTGSLTKSPKLWTGNIVKPLKKK